MPKDNGANRSKISRARSSSSSSTERRFILGVETREAKVTGFTRTNADESAVSRVSRPVSSRTCPRSASGAGENERLPRPRSTIPVIPPRPVSATNTVPRVMLRVMSSPAITKPAASYATSGFSERWRSPSTTSTRSWSAIRQGSRSVPGGSIPHHVDGPGLEPAGHPTLGEHLDCQLVAGAFRNLVEGTSEARTRGGLPYVPAQRVRGEGPRRDPVRVVHQQVQVGIDVRRTRRGLQTRHEWIEVGE